MAKKREKSTIQVYLKCYCCGDTFELVAKRKMYCSNKCRVKYNRDKKNESKTV